MLPSMWNLHSNIMSLMVLHKIWQRRQHRISIPNVQHNNFYKNTLDMSYIHKYSKHYATNITVQILLFCLKKQTTLFYIKSL